MSDRSLLILYATETGTARDAADRIARQCRRIHFECRVFSMDSYEPIELISEHTVIFVVSTTGSGIEPRSMTSLWNMLLRSDLPTDLFEDLDFAAFGLGDTAYEKFCWPSKKLCRRMQSLGATQIVARGEGDDQHLLGIDGALGPWMTQLLDALLQLHALPAGVETVPEDILYPPRVSMTPLSGDSQYSFDPLQVDKLYHTATLKCNRRITAEDWYQDVRHMEFEILDDIHYEPGDVAVVHPEALADDVESILVFLGWANVGDDEFVITRKCADQSLPDHLPKVATLRCLLTRYLDFNAVPRRSFFQLLRHFTSNSLEREKLDEFLTVEGAVGTPTTILEDAVIYAVSLQQDLYEYCWRVRRTIKEVLAEFRSAKVPREYIFDIFPPMRPREFSIASSIKRHPHQIHICVAIVRYKTKLKVPRQGVCTSYLAGLHPGHSLRLGIRKGLIHLPKDPRTPVICIGPGTGIAPMRSVIQERIQAGSSCNTLYFGCRSATKDQHYQGEFASNAASAQLSYRVACSRDGLHGSKRTYVQDIIREDAKEVWETLGVEGTCVFISGSSNKMPAAVKEAFAFAVETHGGRTPDGAREFLAAMEREGRLVEECWS